MENGYRYSTNAAIAVDQLFNALLGGSCDETLSSRTYRMARLERKGWEFFEKVVNTLFFKDVDDEGRRHCELSYLVEMAGGHMPKAMIREAQEVEAAAQTE